MTDEEKAIAWCEDLIVQSKEIMPQCSDALKAELAEQMEFAETALSTLRDRIACQNPRPLTLDELRNHYITCHDCDDAEYSTTVTCGYVCRSKSSPCRGRVTVGYDFCSYGRRKPEPPEREVRN